MLGPKMLSQSALLFNCFLVSGDVVAQLLLGLFVRANSFGFFLQESFVSTEKYIDNSTFLCFGSWPVTNHTNQKFIRW